MKEATHREHKDLPPYKFLRNLILPFTYSLRSRYNEVRYQNQEVSYLDMNSVRIFLVFSLLACTSTVQALVISK